MALPDVNVNIQDGALGVLLPSNDGASLKIGVASSGTVNTIYSLTTLKQVKDTFGGGPLAEALATHISMSGKPVYAVRVNASVAGTIGAITKSRALSPTITAAGTVVDAFEVIVKIAGAGDLGVATFQYTLDGGDNYSAETVVPSGGTFLLPTTGVTVTFPAGSYQVNDTYTFSTVAPAYTMSDLNAAIDVVLADKREWGFMHVVGAASPTIFAGVATRLAEATSVFRYAFAVLEAADDTDANLISAYGNSNDVRIGVVAGYVEQLSPLTGRSHKRSAAWTYCGRLAAIPPQEDPGRVLSGSLPSITALYRDEFANPGLDAARFTTLRTIIGRSGYWVTNGKLMAPEGSDYDLVQNRRVMDKSCRVARNAALQFLNDNVAVDPATGYILEQEAQAIEAFIRAQLIAAVISNGNASDVQVIVKRDNNILSDRTLYVTIRVLPVAYLKFIEIDIGFRNPANELAAAGGGEEASPDA